MVLIGLDADSEINTPVCAILSVDIAMTVLVADSASILSHSTH